MKNAAVILSIAILTSTGCKNKDSETMNNTVITQTTKSTIAYADVNGLQMYYEIHGAGYPLILIHGGGSTLQTSFGNVLQELAKTHQVIAVEMQAHGHTADIDRPLSFEQDADDIAALLKHIGIVKANLFGFSNGASTTLQFAIRYPEMANKIIVASAFYKKTGASAGFWDMMMNADFSGMPQLYKDEFLKINPDSVALYRMYERDVTRMQSFADIPDEQIKSIKAPALIILGDKDIITPEHAVEMHRLLSNSSLAIFPGGHGDYIGEATTPKDTALIAATISMINKFLNEPAVK